MKNKAFTLIELLVVVLIIGILAAIAVPKYQLAVAKSKYSNLKSLVNSITEAQQVYFLTNNELADSFDKLDVTMPAGKDEERSLANKYYYSWGNCHFGGAGKQVICTNSDIGIQYQAYPVIGVVEDDGARVCMALNNDINSIPNKICQQETGKEPNCGTYCPYGYNY